MIFLYVSVLNSLTYQYILTHQNKKIYIIYLQKCWEDKFALGMNELAYNYAKGTYGVKKDMPKAVEWWHQAAEQGDVEAQYNLGMFFFKGDCGKQDKKEAVKWLRKAAEQGCEEAKDALRKLGEE